MLNIERLMLALVTRYCVMLLESSFKFIIHKNGPHCVLLLLKIDQPNCQFNIHFLIEITVKNDNIFMPQIVMR